MPIEKLEKVHQSQKERLFFIDFKLRFLGSLNRNDLVERFGIKDAAATRDLALYRELAPTNLNYSAKAKNYLATETFNALFKYPDRQALSALCFGLGDDQVNSHAAYIPAEAPTQLNYPNLDTLAEITKAIYQNKSIHIEYRSMSSGISHREIVPNALVDNGLRWHVRAYDRKRQQFSDFVINRIAKPRIIDSSVLAHEKKESDNQWNRIVELHLTAHPKLPYPETIEMEYGMQNGLLKINVRAAVVGYELRKWNVDCSADYPLEGAHFHLWLQNTPTLYGVDNLSLAPGAPTEFTTQQQ